MPSTTTENGILSAGYEGYWKARWEATPTAGNGPSTTGSGQSFLKSAINRLVGEANWTILDVGCGAANQWGRYLPCAPENYTGVDISKEAIAYAKGKHPKATFIVHNMTQLSQKLPAADIVICTDMMQHIKPEDALNVIDYIKFLAKRHFVIRSWFNHPEWHGAGGYHWNNEEPKADDRWDIEKEGCPDGISSLYIGTRKAKK